jgi:hypothetical protein
MKVRVERIALSELGRELRLLLGRFERVGVVVVHGARVIQSK